MELCRLMKHASLLAESDKKEERFHGLREMILHLDSSSDDDEYGERVEAYTRYLDNMDTTVGLNNFADEILRASRRQGAESRTWQSSLTVDFFQQKFSAADFQQRDTSLPEEKVVLPPFPRGAEKRREANGPPQVPPQSGSPHISRENRPRGLVLKRPTSFSSGAGNYEQSAKPSNNYESLSVGWEQNVKPSGEGFASSASASSSSSSSNSCFSWNQRAKSTRPVLPPKPDAEPSPPALKSFKTAREKLVIDRLQRNGGQKDSSPGLEYGLSKRSLGTTNRSRGVSSQFVPPVGNAESEAGPEMAPPVSAPQPKAPVPAESEETDERLAGLEPRMIELIRNEIMDHGPSVTWDEIAGLDFAKATIKEIVIFPMLRPDIFTGLRGPPKGLLLFGPPGTGKTLIGKCIASQSRSTFFSISASSLTSKWVGEGEKMVRALFAVARVHQPAVIFIDEIDSLLSQRSDQEHESSRRIKTEFLVQLDGVTTGSEERILVVGATNRPHEIDEAARRRFVKRLYIPLPCAAARRQIVDHLMREQHHCLDEAELASITRQTDGYSGADVANLCREAAMGPVRSISIDAIADIRPEDVRPIALVDFEEALTQVRASVSQADLRQYVDWNEKFGSFKRTQ